MVDVGRAWHDLAMALKAASEEKRPDFSDVSQRLRILVGNEAAYHAEAVTLGCEAP